LISCAIVGAVAWGGCTRAPQREEVIGTYVLNKGRAHDELVLYPTSLYVHNYMPAGAPAIIDSGQWRIDSRNGSYRLVFTKFIMRARNESFPGAQQPRGTWVVTVDKTITGKLQLEVDGDIGWYYVKEQGVP
jgi:hypothetical protein